MKGRYCLLLVFLLFCSCGLSEEKRIKIKGYAQGSFYEISYLSASGTNLKPQIDSILNAFDRSISLWDTTSILVQVNRNIPVPLDSIFIDNFNKSIMMAELTNGAFDITIGGLVDAWGFGNAERQKIDSAKIDSLRQFVGYQNVQIKDGKLEKKYPQTRIDFNAIAQGYVVDLIGDYLKQQGIENFIIDIAGEILAKGHKEKGKKWLCGIETPAPDRNAQQTYNKVIALENQALVTSGNYRKYYEEDGRRYAHTIDPATGYPVRHTLLSATVLTSYAWEADALATAFMVIGLDSAKKFLEQHPKYEAHFVFVDDAGEMQTFTTEGLELLSVEH